VRLGRTWGVEEKKTPQKENQLGLRKGKNKVNLSLPPWLAQGQGMTTNVHP
jgi:hypothetical protein